MNRNLLYGSHSKEGLDLLFLHEFVRRVPEEGLGGDGQDLDCVSQSDCAENPAV